MTKSAELSETTLSVSNWHAYFELCKPRVVALILLTSTVGMLLAASTGGIPLSIFIWGTLGIGLMASAGAAFNHVLDRKFDEIMYRTQYRPLPSKSIKPTHALIFASTLAIIGMLLLYFLVNPLTALLTFLTFMGYAVIYTVFLKHATPQNIVIGGASGAMPPVLGWVAVTQHLDPNSLLLFLIVFVWTPPHFWALAIHRLKEYEKANIPMLPVTHGIEFTKLNILLYTILLFIVSLLPFVVGMSGIIYLIGAVILNSIFLYWAIKLKYRPAKLDAMKTFRFSIWYLMILFVALLVDHYCLMM